MVILCCVSHLKFRICLVFSYYWILGLLKVVYQDQVMDKKCGVLKTLVSLNYLLVSFNYSIFLLCLRKIVYTLFKILCSKYQVPFVLYYFLLLLILYLLLTEGFQFIFSFHKLPILQDKNKVYLFLHVIVLRICIFFFLSLFVSIHLLEWFILLF